MSQKAKETLIYAGGTVPRSGEGVRSYQLHLRGKVMSRSQEVVVRAEGEQVHPNGQASGPGPRATTTVVS